MPVKRTFVLDSFRGFVVLVLSLWFWFCLSGSGFVSLSLWSGLCLCSAVVTFSSFFIRFGRPVALPTAVRVVM